MEAYSRMFFEKTIILIGKLISLMIPVITLLMIAVIIARYFFGIGLTGVQELIMYIHALIFLGCAGFVHLKDEHVRVDIFYRKSKDVYKQNINGMLVGHQLVDNHMYLILSEPI